MKKKKKQVTSAVRDFGSSLNYYHAMSSVDPEFTVFFDVARSTTLAA